MAGELNVVGWVRNLSDGSVEVMARGAVEALGRLEEALWRGAPMGRVDRVDSIACTLPDDVGEFTIGR